ncbi:H-NS histone family protein [Sinorhizobium medicae]|uniref:H-NS histone family protein n=1 Tax=Sinorhizobium medicae TaxID=110321 RepID=UPI002AF6BAB3|nr:H-NS histone family protein [Sinorhizobium medicae]WQO60044.1 H-NS histone family protein [Sinorhizobium medicae]
MATSTDVSRLSLEDLNVLIEDATKRRDELIEKRRQELMKQLADLDALSGKPKASPAASRSRASPAPKYRSQANPDLTWVGRGGTPKWLVAEMAEKNLPMEAFLIK